MYRNNAGRDCAVCIATRYGLEGPGIECRWRRNFLHLSTSVLGPTKLPVKWILGLSPGVKAAGAFL